MSEAKTVQAEEIPLPDVEELELDSESSDDEKSGAERQGWTDRDQWRGEPEKWVTAKEFLRRGEETLPILKSNFKKLEDKFDKQTRTIEDFVKFQEEKEGRIRKEAYDQALKDVRDKQAAAVKQGDTDAFVEAQKEEDAIRQEQAKPETKTTKPAVHPDWQGWLDENSWYEEDEEAGALADALSERIGKARPELTGKAFYEEVKTRVKKAMPHKFENTNRKKAASVESGGGGKARAKGKTYSDLPVEAKQACDEYVASIPGYTKDQYIKDFDWSTAQ